MEPVIDELLVNYSPEMVGQYRKPVPEDTGASGDVKDTKSAKLRE